MNEKCKKCGRVRKEEDDKFLYMHKYCCGCTECGYSTMMLSEDWLSLDKKRT